MLRLLLPMVVVLVSIVGSGDVIHACVQNGTGNVRIVSADVACTGDETALTWAVVGIQGPIGPKGDAGPAGPPGVGDIGCNTDQIAKWDGSQWVCAGLPNTAALQSQVTDLQAQVAALQDTLQHVSRNGNNLVISGANLQVVNGLDDTRTTNRLGNVIIGYNESRGGQLMINERGGSHNLVIGKDHVYKSYGGIVAGEWNTISAIYATAIGGRENVASGQYASVCGGTHNSATHTGASVSGGSENTAGSSWASVSGGQDNTASSVFSTVSGGYKNTASGEHATVSGGKEINATLTNEHLP